VRVSVKGIDTAIHARHQRTLRFDKKDPVSRFTLQHGAIQRATLRREIALNALRIAHHVNVDALRLHRPLHLRQLVRQRGRWRTPRMQAPAEAKQQQVKISTRQVSKGESEK